VPTEAREIEHDRFSWRHVDVAASSHNLLMDQHGTVKYSVKHGGVHACDAAG